MNKQDVVQALAALAHPVRLDVFRQLVVAGHGGVTPGELSRHLEVAPNALSFHLKELSHAGLATQEREGRHLKYRAAYERMDALLTYLTLNCCQGLPQQAEAATDGRDCGC